MTDHVLTGLQAELDAEGDGWLVTHYVAIIGFTRFRGTSIETDCAIYTPDSQPDYITEGLLQAAHQKQRTETE